MLMQFKSLTMLSLFFLTSIFVTHAYGNSALFSDEVKANNELVLTLQNQLNDLGMDAGSPDGVWGRRTAGAIDAFVDRFPPLTALSTAQDAIDRIQFIHDSWLKSPFDGDTRLITPPGSLFSNEVFQSDIRTLNLDCDNCSLVTFILGAGDFDADGIDEIVAPDHVRDASDIQVEIPTRTLIIDLGRDHNPRPLELYGTEEPIRRVHEREALIEDFNGDSVDDLFIAAHGLDAQPFPGEQNVLLLSSPNGPIDASLTHLPVINDMAHGAGSGDIDNDGDIDIVVMTHPGSGRYDPYLLRNDGTGNFQRELLNTLVDDPRLLQLYSGGLVINQYSSARLLDMNNDSNLDLILLRCCQNGREYSSDSHILFNKGDGTFSVTDMITLPTDRWGELTYTNDAEAIDLDGNGLIDLILAQSTQIDNCCWKGHYVQIFMQEEEGVFVDRTAERMWPQGYELPLRNIQYADDINMADLDRDGDMDMIIVSYNPVMRSRDLSTAIAHIGINVDGSGSFLPLDPRYLSNGQPHRFNGPIAGRFGPNGEAMMASFHLHGFYSPDADITYGAKFSLHRPQ